jgi:hypothetical protein
VFHVDLLTPYIETDFHSPNYTRPPPDLINEEEEYEVEQVLSSRHHGRGHKVQYLVKWKGYPDSDNEWVNWDDMHAEEALKDFRKQNPRAITHIRRTQSTAENQPPHYTRGSTVTSQCPKMLSAPPYLMLSARVPSPRLESRVPYPQTTINYAGSQYSPPNNHPEGDGTKPGMLSTASNPLAGGLPLNPLIALQPVHPNSVDPTAPRYTEFSIPQTLIGRAGSTPHVRLLEELVSEPSSPTNNITTDPTSIPSSTCSNSPLPIPLQLDYLGAILDQTRRLCKGPPVIGPNSQSQEAASFRITPEQRFEEDINLLTQIPTGGRRLTRKMFHQFEKRGHHPLKVTATI